MSSLGEEYPKEIQRIVESLAFAEAENNPAFAFYIAGARDLIDRANAANGDIVEMLPIYEEMKGFS